jgi:ferredoxin
MPKIFFITDKIELDVAKGTSLQDAVKQSGATLPFGCRLGSCGTCRVLVEEGMENLNPMTSEENDLFESLTSVGKTERLGCQLLVYGNVKIRS